MNGTIGLKSVNHWKKLLLPIATSCKRTIMGPKVSSTKCKFRFQIFNFRHLYSFSVGEDEAMDTSPDDQQTYTEPYEEWRDRMIAKAKDIIKMAKAQQSKGMDLS